VSAFPGRRLGVALALLAILALAAAWWPALLLPLAGGTLVLLALVAIDLALLRRIPSPQARRELPDRAFVGRPAEVVLRIHNEAAEPVRVDVVDELPPDLAPSDPSFASVSIEAHGQTQLRYAVQPRERGDRPFGALVLLQHSPLGLLRRRQVSTPAAALRVYPDASRYLRSEALDLERTLASIGVKPTRRAGEGIEFETLREYVPGDDPRRLDWAATARRGRPITRIFSHERNQTVWIALEAGRLMGERCGERTKLDGAIDAALALAFVSLVSGDRTGAIVFDREVRGLTAARGRRSQLGAILELFRHIQPRGVEADYAHLFRALASRPRALVVVIGDFVEAFTSRMSEALVALARRHRVLLVVLRSPVFAALDRREPDAAGPALDLYGRLVVDDLLREREEALAGLRRQGVLTLDATLEGVVAPVIRRYLQLRYGREG
jgi:uncharacterized protein (DUF58 family)